MVVRLFGIVEIDGGRLRVGLDEQLFGGRIVAPICCQLTGAPEGNRERWISADARLLRQSESGHEARVARIAVQGVESGKADAGH